MHFVIIGDNIVKFSTMDSKLPKVRQVWQPAKSNLLRSIPGLASAKESLPIMKRPHTNLRRSKSFSELQIRKPISDRNGLVIHPLLPKGDIVKSNGFLAHSRDLAKSNGCLAQNKENKPFVRNNMAAVKRAGAPIVPNVAAKFPRNANVSASNVNSSKTPSGAKPAAVNKKIPLYDYKARFNDLLERHKPMKEEYLELKRTRDTIEEELEEMRTQWESYAVTLEEYKKKAEVDRSQINQLTNDNSALFTKYEIVVKENEELKARLGEITSELFYSKQTLEETTRKLSNCEEVNRQQEQVC